MRAQPKSGRQDASQAGTANTTADRVNAGLPWVVSGAGGRFHFFKCAFCLFPFCRLLVFKTFSLLRQRFQPLLILPFVPGPEGTHLLTHAVKARNRARPISETGRCQPGFVAGARRFKFSRSFCKQNSIQDSTAICRTMATLAFFRAALAAVGLPKGGRHFFTGGQSPRQRNAARPVPPAPCAAARCHAWKWDKGRVFCPLAPPPTKPGVTAHLPAIVEAGPIPRFPLNHLKGIDVLPVHTLVGVAFCRSPANCHVISKRQVQRKPQLPGLDAFRACEL